MNAELELLLRLHDGDDRCGCLAHALLVACTDGPAADIHKRWTTDVPDLIRTCLETHPAGQSHYRKT